MRPCLRGIGAGEPRVRLLQRAPRQHRRQMLAIGRRRVDVVDRLELAAALAGVAEELRARLGAVPMPPIVTDARVILPPASASISAAADVIAKSPWRRENSTKA